jgi:hypothetical protein
VKAGVKCQQCHGPVETMETVKQVSSLAMGWCINCHRDANEHRIEGLEDKELNAPLNCSTCHY